MNIKEIETLESYFKTENEHWNRYAFEMICDVMKQNNFDNPEIALDLFDMAITIFTEQHEAPLKAVMQFDSETEKAELNPNQKLFIVESVYRYVSASDFGELDLNEIKYLLKSQTDKLKNDKLRSEYNKPLTGNIRDTLKDLIQKELDQLPETLKTLDPVQRLNVLCKLMPYVMPKTESVKHTLGEPEQLKRNWIE